MTSIPTSNLVDADMITAAQNNTRVGNLVKNRAVKMSPEKINEVASDFEAQFISQMLENMFSTVDTKESLGGNDAEDIYRSMEIDEYGKIIARSGGIGVADHVKREMLKMQEM